jgi:hypothetical protein
MNEDTMNDILPAAGKDPRTARLTPAGRVPTIDGHFSPRMIRSYAAALLDYRRKHRLNKRAERELLEKVAELRAELMMIYKLRKALKAGKTEPDAEPVVQPVTEEPRLTKKERERQIRDSLDIGCV